MTMPIDTTGTTAGTTAGSSGATGVNQLDNSQTFLQLLVAQLENQDPTNPTDPTAFMTEIAQLTEVQSQTSLASEEQTVAADSMIGNDVVGSDQSGNPVSGNVTGVLLSSTGTPFLMVDVGNGTTDDVSISTVTQVTKPSSG